MRSTNDKVDSRESRLAQYAAEGFGESVLSHWVEVSKAHAYLLRAISMSTYPLSF